MESKESIEIASGEVGLGFSVGCMPTVIPAIVIINRCGDVEKVMEFATSDDYKAWKELE